MRAVVGVSFNSGERTIFERMLLGLWVGFPKPEWDSVKGKSSPKNEDARAHRLLSRLATKGDVFYAEQIRQVRLYLEDMIDTLRAESTEEFWISELDHPENISPVTQQMITVLYTHRAIMLEDAEEALALIRTSADRATPVRFDERDDDADSEDPVGVFA